MTMRLNLFSCQESLVVPWECSFMESVCDLILKILVDHCHYSLSLLLQNVYQKLSKCEIPKYSTNIYIHAMDSFATLYSIILF